MLGIGTPIARLSSYQLVESMVRAPNSGSQIADSLALVRHPSIRAAEQSVRLAEIGAKRARAVQYPSLVASAQRSKIEGNQSISSSGIVLRMEVPIQAASVFKGASADLELRRVRQQQQETVQKISLELTKLGEQLEGAHAETLALREAIVVAQQSVEATEKSFIGGVRTRIDVLNALQTVYQLKTDYLASMLRFGEIHLMFDLASARDPEEALQRVEAAIFVRVR
jgi:protease secretion system outer membrane protein